MLKSKMCCCQMSKFFGLPLEPYKNLERKTFFTQLDKRNVSIEGSFVGDLKWLNQFSNQTLVEKLFELSLPTHVCIPVFASHLIDVESRVIQEKIAVNKADKCD